MCVRNIIYWCPVHLPCREAFLCSRCKMKERFSEMIEIQQVLLSLATLRTTTCLNLWEKLSQFIAERRWGGDVVTVQTDYRLTVRQSRYNSLHHSPVCLTSSFYFPAQLSGCFQQGDKKKLVCRSSPSSTGSIFLITWEAP